MDARALSALLTVALLAGCAGPGGADASGAGPQDAACAPECPPAPLNATTPVAVPAWVPGQWWEWQVSYSGEPMDETFRSIVVAADGQGRLLATEHPGRAKDEAAFDVLLLGAIGPRLQMSRAGVEWDILSFPLSDGKQWSTTIPNIAWDGLQDEVQLDLSAHFDADLPGYRIMGHVPEGMLLEATYLPATGWFGEFTVFDIDEGQHPEEFRMEAVATGLGYTGTYHLHTAEPLLVHESYYGLTAPPPEGEPVLSPNPYASFVVPDEATSLYGFVEVFSAVGANTLVVTPPEGEPRYALVPGAPEGGQVLEFDEPALPGEWRLGTVGAGGATAVLAVLYGITESTYTM